MDIALTLMTATMVYAPRSKIHVPKKGDQPQKYIYRSLLSPSRNTKRQQLQKWREGSRGF